MNLTSDKELKNLFKKAGKEIPDRGFTKRVMHALPQEKRSSNQWIIWVFSALGILTALVSGAISVFIRALATFGHNIAHLQKPEMQIAVIYLMTITAIIGFTTSLFRKDMHI